MKTLRVTLADLEGIPHATAAAATAVTVTAAYTGPVILTDGTIIPTAIKAKTVGSSGVVNFSVHAADDPAVREDHRGFAITVTAQIRLANGSVTAFKRTVKPLESMGSTVQLGDLAEAEGLPAQWVTAGDVLEEFISGLDGYMSQMTVTHKATLTNPAAPRPSWPGIVDWWVPVGSGVPAGSLPGDLVTEVAAEPAPWSPTSIASLGGWWSAYNPGPLVGDTVTAWPDQSANNAPALAEVGTVTYSATALNGLPGLTFAETSRLRTTTLVDTGTGSLTYAWTGQFSGSGAHCFFGGRYSEHAGPATYVGRDGSNNYTARRSGITSDTTVAADNSPHYFAAVFDDTAVRLYVDGALIHTGTVAAARTDNLIIGGAERTAGGVTSQFYLPGGAIGEMVWMTGALDNDNPGDFATLNGWLADRVGLA